MSGLMQPRHIEGRTVWYGPEVDEMNRKMQFGSPIHGWQGDPSFALYLARGTRAGYVGKQQWWEVWGVDNRGDSYCVTRAKPGMLLDDRLIIGLVAHDPRHHNIAAEIALHNERTLRELQQKNEQARREVLAELRHAARRAM